MADNNRSWIRDLLAVPLVVGIVIAIFTYALPKLLTESSQLSYTIEEPVAYLDKTSIGTASVKVNDISVPEVFAVRVRIWNSGSLPLKNLGVLFEFAATDKDFRVLSVNHNTNPPKEFGAVTEEGNDTNSKRFIYALLNSEDADSLVFLTTAKADVKVFSKAENLSVKPVSQEKRTGFHWYDAAILAMLVSLVSSFIEFLLKVWRERRRNKKSTQAGESGI
ncbi:MAG TPA: hypothetical protein PLH85_09230 [Rhodocyclaceae bacterium]|nr:hypothetical protein [Rhodocyclaceae bacterium]